MPTSNTEEQLIMLGTGNATAIHCYNTCYLIRNPDSMILVDCGGGNGILRQLHDSGIDYRMLHDIFITHGHADHLFGLFWLIRVIGTAMNKGDYTGDLRIYCHNELIPVIRTIGELTIQPKFYKHMDKRIFLIGVEDKQVLPICGYEFHFFDIQSKKMKQFGFATTLKNGKRLTCLGDEPCTDAGLVYAAGSDWLLREVLCLYRDKDIFKPYEKNHDTVKDACTCAEQWQVKNLLLCHTEDKQLSQRKALYQEEGKRYFTGRLFIPDDLEIINL